MADELFEVAFNGGIAEGADPAQVRVNIGKMFKADDAKLEQLFSGKRVVIKKNIDQQTAMKYQAAMSKAGAVCEVKNLSTTEPAPPPPVETAPAPASPARVAVDHDVPPAPETEPLHITGDQIADLAATLAPVGSDVQDAQQAIPEPQLDLSGLDMAPVGADLVDPVERKVPPPPNTDGLSLKD